MSDLKTKIRNAAAFSPKEIDDFWLGKAEINDYASAKHQHAQNAWAFEALLIAVEALKFECGNRCAEQNPCNAKEALTEIAALVPGGKDEVD